jgi:hypothetical protein
MTIFFATIGGLILIVVSPFLFNWINELTQKRVIQKMNNRFEQVEKYLKESVNEGGANRIQTN